MVGVKFSANLKKTLMRFTSLDFFTNLLRNTYNNRSKECFLFCITKLFHEVGRSYSALCVHIQFYFYKILLQSRNKVDYQLDYEVFVIFLQNFVCYQKTNIISLYKNLITDIGFLLMSSNS